MEYLCNYFPLTLLASVCAKGIFIRFFSIGNDIEKKIGNVARFYLFTDIYWKFLINTCHSNMMVSFR